MIKTFFKLLFNIGSTVEVFTKVGDKNDKGVIEYYGKSHHVGIIKLNRKGFYLQEETYRTPLWVDLKTERVFGIETKYVIK